MILLLWIIGFISAMLFVFLLIVYWSKPTREERINQELRGENH